MTDIPNKSALRFGIPSLDDLFGTFSVSHTSYGIPVASPEEQIKLTIVGPAGSGKSILALHLASRYRADAHSRMKSRAAKLGGDEQRAPRVIYISTDLTLPKAKAMWTAFALDRPNMRDVPLYRPASVTGADPIEVAPEDIALQAELQGVNPIKDTGESSFAEFLLCNQLDNLFCAATVTPLNETHADTTRKRPRTVSIGFLDLVTHPIGDL